MPTEIFDPAPATPPANAATHHKVQAGSKRKTTSPEVATGADEESHGDEEASMASASDDDSLKEVATPSRGGDEETASKAETGTPSSAADGSETPGQKKAIAAKKGRTPAVKGLSIPFRTVKKVSSFCSNNSTSGLCESRSLSIRFQGFCHSQLDLFFFVETPSI
jgi:hypothetical protein